MVEIAIPWSQFYTAFCFKQFLLQFEASWTILVIFLSSQKDGKKTQHKTIVFKTTNQFCSSLLWCQLCVFAFWDPSYALLKLLTGHQILLVVLSAPKTEMLGSSSWKCGFRIGDDHPVGSSWVVLFLNSVATENGSESNGSERFGFSSHLVLIYFCNHLGFNPVAHMDMNPSTGFRSILPLTPSQLLWGWGQSLSSELIVLCINRI